MTSIIDWIQLTIAITALIAGAAALYTRFFPSAIDRTKEKKTKAEIMTIYGDEIRELKTEIHILENRIDNLDLTVAELLDILTRWAAGFRKLQEQFCDLEIEPAFMPDPDEIDRFDTNHPQPSKGDTK